MFLSDNVKDDFKPINLSSLESHDEEKVNHGKKLEPDWDKFKVFYKKIKSEQKEEDNFKSLFDLGKKEEKEEKPAFEQFGKEKNDKSETEDDERESSEIESGNGEDIKDSEYESKDENEDESTKEGLEQKEGEVKPELTPEQGYEQGFENGKQDGYEKGLDQGKKEGHEQGEVTGYKEGYSKGEAEISKEIDEKIQEREQDFKEMLLKLDNTYHELAQRYEEKIIALICKISEKVVLAKVEIDDEIVKETMLDALKTLSEPEDITLSVSIEDYEYVEMVKEDLFEFIKTLKSVSVISDTSVKRGGCRIETKEGYVEVDIEEKLEKVFTSIQGKQLT